MKTQFVDCKARTTAEKRMPWAAKIVKVGGGYMGFESVSDYQVWRKQK